MTMKGARRIYHNELGRPLGAKAPGFRTWVREAVVANPSLGAGTFGKLGRIIRGPVARAGEIRQ